MKDINEMKFLARMARNMGQPDKALEEAIRKEELLVEKLFAAPKADPIPILREEILVEADPTEAIQEPAETNIVPKEKDLIQQTVDAISDVRFQKPALPDFQSKEIDGVRKQLAEVMQKMGTLSWGGGGTGVVRINDTDDFDKASYADGRYLQWTGGMFRLREVNPHDVIYTTTIVTSATYQVSADDYYVGVNYAGPTTITLPASPASGEVVVIKDESGNAQNNNIHIVGTIDNDTGGATIAINNGALQLIYRNGWRII